MEARASDGEDCRSGGPAGLQFAVSLGSVLEREALLVDHRGYWERLAVPPGGTRSWFDGPPDRAGAVGHAALARLLCEALWRCRPGHSIKDLTPSREDAEIRQEGR